MKYLEKKIPFLLPTLLLLISLLPFFLYIPLTGISNDTFTYYYWVFQWKAPYLTEGLYYKTDLPLGLPILLYLFDDTHPTHLYLIAFQILLFYASVITLVHTVQKNMSQVASLFVSVFLCLYIVDSYTLRHLTTLYTEAVYASILLFLSSGLISVFYSPQKRKFILLSILISMALLFRSNAIYLFVLIPIGLILINRFNPQLLGLKNIRVFFTSLFITSVIFFSLSYFLTGYTNYGNFNRISKLLEGEKVAAKNNSGVSNSINADSYLHAKKQLFVINSTIFAQEKPSYYHSFLKELHKSYYSDKIYSKSYKIFDATVLVEDEYRDRVTKQLMSSEKLISSEKYTKIENVKQYPLLFINHLIYKFVNIIWRNYLVLLYFILSFFFVFYKAVKSKFTDRLNTSLFAISLVHIVSVFFLTVLMRGYQVRFTHVSEFVINIVIALTLYQIYQHFKTKRLATQ